MKNLFYQPFSQWSNLCAIPEHHVVTRDTFTSMCRPWPMVRWWSPIPDLKAPQKWIFTVTYLASGSNMRRPRFLHLLLKYFFYPMRRWVHRQQANQMPGHLNVTRLVGVNLFVVCQSLGRAHLSGGGLCNRESVAKIMIRSAEATHLWATIKKN